MVLLNYSKSLFKQATKDYEKLQAFYHQLLYFSIMAFGKKKKKKNFLYNSKQNFALLYKAFKHKTFWGCLLKCFFFLLFKLLKLTNLSQILFLICNFFLNKNGTFFQ